jgi:hypothetical protein
MRNQNELVKASWLTAPVNQVLTHCTLNQLIPYNNKKEPKPKTLYILGFTKTMKFKVFLCLSISFVTF